MYQMNRTVRRTWFNGREYRRCVWHGERVVVVIAVEYYVNPSVLRGTFISRREI